MPISFDLRVGRAGALGRHPWGTSFVVPGADGVERSVEEVFFRASTREIQMQIDFAGGRDVTNPHAQALWPVDLHKMLETLCVNPPGRFPIPRLGLLFAPRYGPRKEVFGAMFDTGFRDDDQANLPIHYWSTPREGAAIFLEAIRDRRPVAQAFADQLSYTIVHELSHVFNLQHTPQVGCFLDTSPAGLGAPPPSSFCFLPEQDRWLNRCATDPRVQPGRMGFGSPEYFDRTRSLTHSSTVASLVTLEITLSLKEFFRWEPVELQLTLRAADHTGSSPITVPAQLDPGYDNFAIWIEEPTGERRRYHPTKHYCPSDEVLVLPPGAFFRRDVSIFGESGGLTFHQPGVHRIWCAFCLPEGGVIRSNVVEAKVRVEQFSDSRSRRRHGDLREIHLHASQAFFYRSGKMRAKPRKALEVLARRERASYLGAAAEYALGRWLEHQLHRNPQTRQHWRKAAKPYLERARDSEFLNSHQRTKADDFLETFRR